MRINTNCASRRSLHAIPAAQARNFAFAFDIDGVLKQGRTVLPEGRRVMKMLSEGLGERSGPIPFVLMTNGGGMLEADRCQALSEELGVHITANQLIQSHTPLQSTVEQFRDKPVLVIGGKDGNARKIAHSYGLRQVYLPQDLIHWKPSLWDRYHLSAEERSWIKPDTDFSDISFSGIFVIHDDGLDWALTTQLVTELLMSDGGRLGTRKTSNGTSAPIPLFFTNPDLIWSTDYPQPRLGMGALRIGLSAVYEALTGQRMPFTQIGKPYKETYQFADEMLSRHLHQLGKTSTAAPRVYMVGDNPASDIAGAHAHGWSSILVRTGVFREAEGPPVPEPTHIANNVEEGVHWAIDRELRKERIG